MNTPPIALVTGANRGIGFEVVRQLALRNVKVYLTSRRAQSGEDAANRLKSRGLDVSFIPLDVTDHNSVKEAFRSFKLKEECLDILINNAGVMQDHGSVVDLDPDLLRRTLETNAFGPLEVIRQFLPVMPRGGKIINLSSGLGSLNDMQSYAPAYSLSKTLVNGLTRQFAAALIGRGIMVNSVCPGWVRTDMGGSAAPRPVQLGAETVVWLALDAPMDVTGKFLRDKKEISW